MLQLYKLNMYVYAETQEEVNKLEQALKDFVNTQREKGVAITAVKLSSLIDKWGGNIMITNFLR